MRQGNFSLLMVIMCGLLFGPTCPINQSETQTIGSEGGVVELRNGITVVIPEGSLLQETEITLSNQGRIPLGVAGPEEDKVSPISTLMANPPIIPKDALPISIIIPLKLETIAVEQQNGDGIYVLLSDNPEEHFLPIFEKIDFENKTISIVLVGLPEKLVFAAYTSPYYTSFIVTQ